MHRFLTFTLVALLTNAAAEDVAAEDAEAGECQGEDCLTFLQVGAHSSARPEESVEGPSEEEYRRMAQRLATEYPLHVLTAAKKLAKLAKLEKSSSLLPTAHEELQPPRYTMTGASDRSVLRKEEAPMRHSMTGASARSVSNHDVVTPARSTMTGTSGEGADAVFHDEFVPRRTLATPGRSGRNLPKKDEQSRMPQQEEVVVVSPRSLQKEVVPPMRRTHAETFTASGRGLKDDSYDEDDEEELPSQDGDDPEDDE